MSPDQIQAIGGAIVAILGAWQARTSRKQANTSRKVRDLEMRLAIVEAERDQFRTKLRAAVRHIREWMGWAMHHAPGQAPPALPMELRDDI
ncbi:Uncharacterised protein [Mycobacteroides abscessus subsp. abscessus]|uniref:hypothetical protein n=1 Tax=Mycobacteroides abscessus TaxID=36809 RepID=UPI000268409B|nr:hypothetical protein [Mycobacteroides abscessus]QPO17342.1 hypothetical protein PHIGD34-2_31 [Mycobacterium phage phiGD34-2]QST90325.1 hypothetical protein PROPHIGD62-1_52 [Mycobacterium phage prophi62-1]QST90716.1 hypothetical protein PROPHIGD34-2_56 [Mycobacterium phage prophiGD34-2]EIV30185.1 hypothetical protein MA3A0119R_0503 [Mycobacteroides abscessus 3A-0119-R]EIV38989.1 hypothetical protein MA3A0122R_0563 [Mycobacteroides abscessus 3A-0122-R]